MRVSTPSISHPYDILRGTGDAANRHRAPPTGQIAGLSFIRRSAAKLAYPPSRKQKPGSLFDSEALGLRLTCK